MKKDNSGISAAEATIIIFTFKSMHDVLKSEQNLISIFVFQSNRLRLIIHSRLLKIFQRSIRVCFP